MSFLDSRIDIGAIISAITHYWLRVFLFLEKENQREGYGFEEMQC